jgi:hypothetical protein
MQASDSTYLFSSLPALLADDVADLLAVPCLPGKAYEMPRAQVHLGDDAHPLPPHVARLSGRASDGGSRGMMLRQLYAAAGSRVVLAR